MKIPKMSQVMSKANLKKKLVEDIMFANGSCRINVITIVSDTRDDNVFDSESRYHITKSPRSGRIDATEIERDDYNIYYNIATDDNKIFITSTYKDIRSDLDVFVWYKNGNEYERYLIYDIDPEETKFVFLELFRVSHEGYVYPIIYRVTGDFEYNDPDLHETILNDWLDGCKKFDFEQITTDMQIKLIKKVNLTNSDAMINEGIDIDSTAEYFAIWDLISIDTNDKNVSYTWNPETNILSVNTSEESQIQVDLYYNENPQLDTISEDTKIFSYIIPKDIITDIKVNYPKEGKFYKSDEFKIEYKTEGKDHLLTEFRYWLHDNIMAEMQYETDSDNIIRKQTITNHTMYGEQKVNILAVCDSVVTVTYQSADNTFTYIENLRHISSITSFVHDFNSMCIRSIAGNVIKIW